MKPILVIGPGTSLLHYTIEPTTGRVVVTCPSCGATTTASETGRRHVTATVKHKPDCDWLADITRSASINRKDPRNVSVH
jgi:predicted RNA-binding Zn-ribbon protein involved in translation (DUF1610 family)